MRRALPIVLVALVGCMGGGEDGGDASGSGGRNDEGSGGAPQTGGGGAPQTGGGGSAATGSGGHGVTGSGGGLGSASGGAVGSGGHLGSGGIAASGGAIGSGGVVASGGHGSGGNAGHLGSGGVGGRGGGDRGGRSGTGGVLGGGGGVGTGGVIGAGGATAPVCSSGKTWTGGNGQDMRPGNDCKGCHSFTIDGTVYPTAHEPDNCDGTAANGIRVVITGADGSTVTLTPSKTSGNFYSNSAIKAPYTAKVTNTAGTVRMMVASQTAGNCNSCHTQDGGNGAPGRIMAP